LDIHLSELSVSLREGRYAPAPLLRICIRKKDNSQRSIGILSVRDRVAQRAALNVLDPALDPGFLDCSYAFRRGRSIQDAVARVVEHQARGYDWVVDADIASFFDSMDHRYLMKAVVARVPDPEIVRLIDAWLRCGAMRCAGPQPWTEALSSAPSAIGEFLAASAGNVLHTLLAGGSALDDPAAIAVSAPDAPADARKEWLSRLGRDAMLYLLSFHREAARLLAFKRLQIAGLAALAAAAGGIFAYRALRAPSGVGTVQGSCLSPMLGNIYLHEFDRKMTQTPCRLVRYCDDLLILCRSRSEAEHALEYASRILGRLRLRLNPAKTSIARFGERFTFLGYIFMPDGRVVPESENGLRMDWARVATGLAGAKQGGRDLLGAAFGRLRSFGSPKP
jgi:RNA-directed DNA polymerase